ncbi:hypothetical protein PLICRDRAFT_35513 [Plicaturopsis crispa FD-325 SS-3]|nr:hypothetical protein PLICRDRAFT_35513 [Plicaturopsis crispa FD-325 SS-3]
MTNHNPSSPPASPSYGGGFFPVAPTSPHAFASFQQSPRDQHAMYAQFGAVAPGSQTNTQHSSANGNWGSLKRFMRRK